MKRMAQVPLEGYPRISQYKFSETGYPRITWDILDKLAFLGICKDNISELTYLGISKDKNLKLAHLLALMKYHQRHNLGYLGISLQSY